VSVCMCVCGVGGYTRYADGTSHESIALYVCECGVCLCEGMPYINKYLKSLIRRKKAGKGIWA